MYIMARVKPLRVYRSSSSGTNNNPACMLGLLLMERMPTF